MIIRSWGHSTITLHVKVKVSHRLSSFSFSAKALKRFKAYLSDRQHYVQLKKFKWQSSPVTSGVPQGFVLCPFVICLFGLCLIFRKHGFHFHCYARWHPALPLHQAQQHCSTILPLGRASVKLNRGLLKTFLYWTPRKQKFFLLAPCLPYPDVTDSQIQLMIPQDCGRKLA